MAAVPLETVCKHHQFGYCKFQENCRKEHILEICKTPSCPMVGCPLRHPKNCKFFSIFGICKFGEHCAYLHRSLRDDTIAKLLEQKDKLQAEVATLVGRVDRLEKFILSISSQKHSSPIIRNTHEESLLMDESSCSSCSNIPQLDGLHNVNGNASEVLECETCGMKFTTEEHCYEHRHYGHEIVIGHDFCCDECLICFKIRVDSD